jgi:predicted RNase H-like HicB family nuclease
MRKYRFPAIIEQDEDGYYVGLVPDLKGCHTQARSLSELEKRLKEAIKLCLSVEKKHPTQNKFVGVHQLEIAVR